MKRIVGVLFICLIAELANAQQLYKKENEQASYLHELQSKYKDILQVKSIGKTVSGKDLWVAQLGNQDIHAKPAIVVIGGLDEYALWGQELVNGLLLETLKGSSSDSIKRMLNAVTLYLIPNINPEATQQYFSSVRYERFANDARTNDDRDLEINEDPFEDLNNDGYITQMRIEDPMGEWVVHDDEPRIMRKAKPFETKKRYKLLSEGVDNDKDEQFNEDGPGGIIVNRNFTFSPDYFVPGSGEHPAEALEVRALMDFLYDRTNIFAVLSIGPGNNLLEPWKHNPALATQQVVKSVNEKDAKLYAEISKLYQSLFKTPKASTAVVQRGDLLQWAYFHYGRISLGTPGWWLDDELKQEEGKAELKNSDGNPDVKYLQWCEQNGYDVFVPWTKINHPDFPDKHVEVGGFIPFSRNLPDQKKLNEAVEGHLNFIHALHELRPTASFVDVQKKNLGNGLTRIKLKIHNNGHLPAIAQIAQNNSWVKLVVVETQLPPSAQLISGRKKTLIQRLDPNEFQELTWVVKGKGRLTFQVGSPQTGIETLDVEL